MSTNQALVEAIYQLLSGGAVPGADTKFAGPLGWRINRPAAVDPQNVFESIFTIAGGVIAVTGLFGVRTIDQAGGASTMQFQHTVAGVFDAGTLAITADVPNTIYYCNGNALDPIISGFGILVEGGKLVATSLTSGAVPLFMVGAGDIKVTMTAAAGTGSTRYVLTYIPLDDAVTVVPA